MCIYKSKLYFDRFEEFKTTSAKTFLVRGGIIVMAIMTSQGRKYESLPMLSSPAHNTAEVPVKSGFHEAFIRAILDQKVIITLVGQLSHKSPSNT